MPFVNRGRLFVIMLQIVQPLQQEKRQAPHVTSFSSWPDQQHGRQVYMPANYKQNPPTPQQMLKLVPVVAHVFLVKVKVVPMLN
jgi:hypothetical protein